MTDPRCAVIADGLTGRLSAVEHRLVGLPTTGEPRARPPGDVEETLRLLMVRFVPRVRRAPTDAGTLEAVLSSLADTAKAAASSDLRFLDAWNNVYEALFEDSRATALTREQAGWLLSAYAEILRAHLTRLASWRNGGT